MPCQRKMSRGWPSLKDVFLGQVIDHWLEQFCKIFMPLFLLFLGQTYSFIYFHGYIPYLFTNGVFLERRTYVFNKGDKLTNSLRGGNFTASWTTRERRKKENQQEHHTSLPWPLSSLASYVPCISATRIFFKVQEEQLPAFPGHEKAPPSHLK